ncbi:dimethyl sulfoxide reductase anchor subunit family protein [Serratia fonticola]|uniref:DmsC/YnfH family molybdoenzyme membrane anchor subunit n=1 Tax=Serratia fonticola TaxID=47917 RepID=A0ABY9PJ95_SERFO|nr:DmsC/YnfH family molybdoenzyme membrane anchor subunit [Serratia fonticola]WMT12808.1 DmsC/YnfH family molybdoenzyme membrane anchor subunit [Serratia fonticola]
MNEYELPLVFFTVLCQWGIGGVIALTLYRLRPTSQMSVKQLKYLVLGLWLVEVVGSSLSLLHLGSPFGAYRAVLGLPHSWLSREVIAFILVNISLFLLLAACWLWPQKSAWITALGLVTSVVGIAAILVSAQIYYQMASHPLWHTPLTQLAFLSTALLLGFATLGIYLSCCGLPVTRTVRYGLLAGCLLLLATLTGRYQIAGASAQGIMLWWQLVGSMLVGGVLFAVLSLRPRLTPSMAVIAGAAMVSGEIVGRMLFYHSVMGQFPWF